MGCVAGFVAVCCLVPDPIQAYRDWRWWPLYAALALVGCVLSAWTAQVVKAKWWSVCGLASMGIMLTHKFPVLFFELKVPLVHVGIIKGILEQNARVHDSVEEIFSAVVNQRNVNVGHNAATSVNHFSFWRDKFQ